jgi:hypothetical protein
MVMLSAFRHYGWVLVIFTDHQDIAASSELTQVIIQYHDPHKDRMAHIRELEAALIFLHRSNHLLWQVNFLLSCSLY